MTSRKPARSASIQIEQQVCFALHAAARTYDALYRELLAGHGLSYPQYLVMIVLGQSGPMGVSDIGATLRLDSGTLSPLLKRLESAGLVARVRDLADERRVEVSLTAAGQGILGDVAQVPARVAEASGLSRAELGSLMDMLRGTTTAVDSELSQRKAGRKPRHEARQDVSPGSVAPAEGS